MPRRPRRTALRPTRRRRAARAPGRSSIDCRSAPGLAVAGASLAGVNARHLALCASAEWAETVRDVILPWAVGDRDLGDAVLELGPGPGLTTDLLQARVSHLTAIELDGGLAAALGRRLVGRVAVVNGDAANLPFGNRRFSAAVCFTMLHHVPSAAHQDQLFAEVRRVLRPGGRMIGVDSLETPAWRELHTDDVCVPVDPITLPDRLAQAGFAQLEVALLQPEARRFRFVATAAG
ncbi:MAG: class I SAM-dependent methyltransferase [Chloroflexi bacterium]|nr:class I SAM-dependent methyltransferase [Chloroflexota bacterium]